MLIFLPQSLSFYYILLLIRISLNLLWSVHPPVSHSTTAVGSLPPVSHSTTAVGSLPPVSHSTTAVGSLPPVSHSTTAVGSLSNSISLNSKDFSTFSNIINLNTNILEPSFLLNSDD
jgi:hypothetical protein